MHQYFSATGDSVHRERGAGTGRESKNRSCHYQCPKSTDEVITKEEELCIFNFYFR